MKIDEKKLSQWTQELQESSKYESKNNKRFIQYYKYVFDKCLTDSDITALKKGKHNVFDFAGLRAYVMHGLKGVKDSMPTSSYKSDNESSFDDHPDIPNEVIADQLTEKLTEIYKFSHFNQGTYRVAKDQYIGGKGIYKVSIDYVNDYNLDQNFIVEHIKNPTLVLFDLKSQEPTKKDARWCAERIPMPEDTFKRTFPNIEISSLERMASATSGEGQFSWIGDNAQGTKEKVINVIDYYYYEYTKKTLYLLEDGSVSEEKPFLEKPLKTRIVNDPQVWRVRYVGETVLKDPERTVFKTLPFSMAMSEDYRDEDGNTILIPYAKHGFDSQRSKNFIYNYYMSAVLNRPKPFTRITEEAVTKSALDAARNRQDGKVEIIKGTALDSTGKTQTTPAVQDIAPPPLPNELLAAAEEMDKNLNSIFGTQFPSVNDMSQMSGKALYNLAQYMSASTEILMQNLMSAITHVGEIIKGGMPEILKSEMITYQDTQTNTQKKVMFDYMFTPSRYKLYSSGGISNQLQREANFENLVGLSKTVPAFGAFLAAPPVMEQKL